MIINGLKIDDIAFGGKGVGRSGGKVVFVPFVIDGEEVSVRVVKQKKNFAEAELLAVEKASPHRVEPGCCYFGTCGGCSYQHIEYGRQLEIKSRQVEQTLKRVGRLGDVPMRPIIASPQPYGYRNRIRVHVSEGTAGFYAADGLGLVDIESCSLASPEVNEALAELRSRAVRDGDYTLAERRNGFFEQTNDGVAEQMLALVEKTVRRGQSLLVDAYCGAGLFGRHLAEFFERVVGIEENPFAVQQAQRTAVANESYYSGDVSVHLPEILSGGDPRTTTLLLDPPAVGITARVTDAILASMPSEIVYVSCNPATLARDLGILCRSYRLESVTPLDMFPQTAEIEVAAHLSSPL
jgi:23S rRNA (uracil1939-C5)-methyltransferase